MIQLQSIDAAEIGLGLPLEDTSGMGLTKNHMDDRAEPIVYYVLGKNLECFNTRQEMYEVLYYSNYRRKQRTRATSNTNFHGQR